MSEIQGNIKHSDNSKGSFIFRGNTHLILEFLRDLSSKYTLENLSTDTITAQLIEKEGLYKW